MKTKKRYAVSGLLLSATLVLSGCAVGGNTGQGMMGSNSNYYDSNLDCKFPTNLKGAIVTVVLSDMGMTRMMGGIAPMGAHMRLIASPSTVSAGVASLIVKNLGWRTHELVILPLSGNQQSGQRVPGADGKVSESGSVGEASKSCGAGVGSGITSGSASWTTITLKPGRYELICNLANHYADGMYQELDVS